MAVKHTETTLRDPERDEFEEIKRRIRVATVGKQGSEQDAEAILDAVRRALAKARAKTFMEVHRRTQNLRKASERVALRTWLRGRATALDKESHDDHG